MSFSTTPCNLACAFAILLAKPAFCLPAQLPDNLFWQRQNIYQIITDRFYDGEPATLALAGLGGLSLILLRRQRK